MKKLIILLLVTIPAFGYSQKILDVVALTDGKVIVIYENKTWKYTDEIKSASTPNTIQSFAPATPAETNKASTQAAKPQTTTTKPSTTPVRYAPSSSSVSSQCTAKTQKGTRCKRMVRGGGRCWQH